MGYGLPPSASLTQTSSAPVWSEMFTILAPSSEYEGADSRPAERMSGTPSAESSPPPMGARQTAATEGLSS